MGSILITELDSACPGWASSTCHAVEPKKKKKSGAVSQSATCCKAETSFLKVYKSMRICQPGKNLYDFRAFTAMPYFHLFSAP